MSASHHKLDNLISIVDQNKVQIDGRVSAVMEIEPLKEKWKSFGWKVFECDGNDIAELIETFEKAESVTEKPSVIIANTKMGKGQILRNGYDLSIFTVEEHQVAGGFGSAVAELVVKNHPVPMAIIGMEDCFGESGQPAEPMQKYGLTAENICQKAKALLRSK